MMANFVWTSCIQQVEHFHSSCNYNTEHNDIMVIYIIYIFYYGLSEQQGSSIVVRLICELIEMCKTGSEAIQQTAAKCLGSIGTADLSTLGKNINLISLKEKH